MAKNIHLTLAFHCPSLGHLISHEVLNLSDDLNKAKKTACSASGSERTILSLFYQQPFDELPIATLGSMAEGLNADQGYWLRADPIHIRLTHNAAYFIGSDDLDLKPDEIKSLLASINTFLSQDHLQLYAPQADQWYFHCQQAPDIFTFAPGEVIGKDIYEYLTKGTESRRWRHLFTELQMLLNRHEVNIKRRSQGQLEINGLWFWGCGQLPTKVAQNWNKVWTDLTWLQGLTEYLNVPRGGGCENIVSCLDQIDTPGDYLIVKQLSADQLQQRLKQWCDLAFEWVKKKRGHQLTIYPGDGYRYASIKKLFARFRR